MTARKVPFLEGLRTVDLSGYDIQTAFGHATERYENLRVILCMLYALHQMGIIPASTTAIKGAEWQKERGSRPDDTQAAHTMPRRLMVGGRSLSEWLMHSNDEMLRYAIANIEGTVTTLPTYINKADTRWENSGLSENYARAAQEVLHLATGDVSVAAEHYVGVWRRFHHEAGGSLLNARSGATGDVAGVLGMYHVVHGNDRSKAADKNLVRYYWNMLS